MGTATAAPFRCPSQADVRGGERRETYFPLELEAAARTAGYQDRCGFETDYREGWLKHPAACGMTLPVHAGWIATIWTRGAVRQQAHALGALIES